MGPASPVEGLIRHLELQFHWAGKSASRQAAIEKWRFPGAKDGEPELVVV